MRLIVPSIRIGWLTALAIMPLAACGRKGADDEAETASLVAVDTAPVSSVAFAPTIHAVGNVVASPRGYAELSAPAATRVSRVLVNAGQRVRAGEPLVELDAASLHAASSGADAARDAAQRAYERAARLAKDGILPQKAVEQASADLAQANAAAVGASHTYALSTIRSPITGVITRMSAVTGASVDPSQVLVSIADPTELQLLFQVAPGDAARLRTGAAVSFFDSDSSASSAIGHGDIATIGAAIDSASRAVPVRVRVISSTRPLRFGETLVGKISVPGPASALSIPAAALVPDSNGFRVYVVRKGIAYATPVQVGTRGDSVVQITKGLRAGEAVVTTGAYGLEDSSKVFVPRR